VAVCGWRTEGRRARWGYEIATADPLNVNGMVTWQSEMRRALRESGSLPPPARHAIAQLLERFLEEDGADPEQQHEVRAAIGLLRRLSYSDDAGTERNSGSNCHAASRMQARTAVRVNADVRCRAATEGCRSTRPAGSRFP
jgi:hypothetical protein